MARPVKLAYVTTVAVTQWCFLRGQNAFLAERGFEIHAIASPTKYFNELGERDGVTVHPVSIARTLSPVRDVVSAWRLFRVFRRIRPDIAHVSTPKAALLGAVAAWAAGVPVRIFCVRGSITASASGVQRRVFRLAERLTARLCHEVVCVSPSLLEFARSESILPAGRGLVAARGMSNGVDVDRFDRAKVDATATGTLPDGLQRLAAERDAIVVGYVGRLARDKGIEVLWRAWARIREEYAGAHLLLVGPWEREAPVSEACRHALESDDRVHLTGDVADVVPYYRLMSMFVLPSFREGFPNAPMEAAAMGLPVIATRVVGAVDAVEDGVTGLLVPPRDADALAAAMRTYLDAPDLRRRHGDAGATRVRTDFRQEVIWDALLQEYHRLLCHGGVGFADTAPQLGAASLRGAFVHEERTR